MESDIKQNKISKREVVLINARDLKRRNLTLGAEGTGKCSLATLMILRDIFESDLGEGWGLKRPGGPRLPRSRNWFCNHIDVNLLKQEGNHANISNRKK